MVDKVIPIADALRIIDQLAFGREVIRWALMKPENRPKSIGDIRTAFPLAAAAMHIPTHVGDTDEVEMVQGDVTRHQIDLPPVYKLLPMLAYLEQDWSDYVATESELGFDPNAPPTVPTVPGGTDYNIPGFYDDLCGGGAPDFVKLFLNRVGDYSFNGCR